MSFLEEESNIMNALAKFPIESDPINPAMCFSDVEITLKEIMSMFSGSDIKYSCISTEKLKYPYEPAQFEFQPILSRKEMGVNIRKLNTKTKLNDNLVTVKSKLLKYKAKCNTFVNGIRKYSCNEFTTNFMLEEDAGSYLNNNGYDPITYIKIYMPFSDKKSRNENIKLQQDIAIKSSQTLLDLAKTIVCPMDFCALDDQSTKLKQPLVPDALEKQNKFPSGLFFIDKRFYVHGSVDLSKPIKTLFMNNKEEVRENLSWSETFANMNIQLGRPYVYQHLGQCEHIVMFSNIRYQTKDVNFHYPAVIAVNNINPHMCMICEAIYARWIVRNCRRLALDEAFLCHTCLTSYCYKGGVKIGDFSVHEYIGIAALT